VGSELDPCDAAVSGLSEIRDGLEPAKNLFDSLSDALADAVALVPSRPRVDGRGAMFVLRDVRRDVQVQQPATNLGTS